MERILPGLLRAAVLLPSCCSCCRCAIQSKLPLLLCAEIFAHQRRCPAGPGSGTWNAAVTYSTCALFDLLIRTSAWKQVSEISTSAVLTRVCFSDYFYDQEERSEEEGEPIYSEDEAVTQKGLRRSQSVKITRSRVRRDVSVSHTVHV